MPFMNKQPKTFRKVDITPRPCSPELAREHLRALGKAFLEQSYLQRWLHLTIEKPEKGEREGLQKFEQHLDRSFCSRIEGADIFPDSLTERFGSKLGVYFDLRSPPCLMTAAEAASHVGFEAILSLEPGRLAIFFTHNRYAWVCERE